MQQSMKIGVLAFHGDVIEHKIAAQNAAKQLNIPLMVVEVRTLTDLQSIDGLIIPGGESTTLQKLSEREKIFEAIKGISYIFGTCAGAILLSKVAHHKTSDQKTLELMDIEIDRNAYGRQTDSFETPLKTTLGNVEAVFIRAPRIKRIGKGIKILASLNNEVVACEKDSEKGYYLAACFHPELTTTIFHQYFLKKIYRI